MKSDKNSLAIKLKPTLLVFTLMLTFGGLDFAVAQQARAGGLLSCAPPPPPPPFSACAGGLALCAAPPPPPPSSACAGGLLSCANPGSNGGFNGPNFGLGYSPSAEAMAQQEYCDAYEPDPLTFFPAVRYALQSGNLQNPTPIQLFIGPYNYASSGSYAPTCNKGVHFPRRSKAEVVGEEKPMIRVYSLSEQNMINVVYEIAMTEYQDKINSPAGQLIQKSLENGSAFVAYNFEKKIAITFEPNVEVE